MKEHTHSIYNLESRTLRIQCQEHLATNANIQMRQHNKNKHLRVV